MGMKRLKRTTTIKTAKAKIAKSEATATNAKASARAPRAPAIAELQTILDHVRYAVTRFTAYLSEKAGKTVQASAPGKQMEDAALALLGIGLHGSFLSGLPRTRFG